MVSKTIRNIMIALVTLNIMIAVWAIASGKIDPFIMVLITVTIMSGLFSIYVWGVPLNTEWEIKEFKIHLYEYEDGRMEGEIELED